MKKVLVGILIIFLIILGSSYYIYFSIFDKNNYNIEFTIKKNKSLSSQLAVIPKAKEIPFKLYLKYRNYGKNIKAGTYHIKGDYNFVELIDILEKGSDKLVKITIPEGYTVEQIANLLVENHKMSKEKFYEELNRAKENFPYPVPNGNFEGYLYPDTYLLPDTFNEETVVAQMLKEFLRQFPVKEYPDKEKFYEKLIMASILEREALVAKEKPLMAGVFYNRIKKGMTLSSDATVNFLYNYKKKRMYYKDLKIDSPYNTYMYKGLPPAPICNPDKVSVEAAYNPTETEYLFFVARGNGEHYFSKTYKEHLKFQKEKNKEKKSK